MIGFRVVRRRPAVPDIIPSSIGDDGICMSCHSLTSDVQVGAKKYVYQ